MHTTHSHQCVAQNFEMDLKQAICKPLYTFMHSESWWMKISDGLSYSTCWKSYETKGIQTSYNCTSSVPKFIFFEWDGTVDKQWHFIDSLPRWVRWAIITTSFFQRKFWLDLTALIREMATHRESTHGWWVQVSGSLMSTETSYLFITYINLCEGTVTYLSPVSSACPRTFVGHHIYLMLYDSFLHVFWIMTLVTHENWMQIYLSCLLIKILFQWYYCVNYLWGVNWHIQNYHPTNAVYRLEWGCPLNIQPMEHLFNSKQLRAIFFR